MFWPKRKDRRRGSRRLGRGTAPSCRACGYETASDSTIDGNGNIIALVNAADGTLAASFEYDPFGNTIKATGAAANAQPFGFSTKYTDTETGLCYYGKRYKTDWGWLSRDPLEENGGLNLYGFVSNNPLAFIDDIGMSPIASLGPDAGALLNGGARANGPIPLLSSDAAFWVIKSGAELLQTGLGGPFSEFLLKRWLSGGGDYTMTDTEFAQHLWGYGSSHAISSRDGTAVPSLIRGKELSLRIIDAFSEDLKNKCSCEGNGFSGDYYIQDYALTSRTLGNFVWGVHVDVKCTKNSIDKTGFTATGVVYMSNGYNYKPSNHRTPSDEMAVTYVRNFSSSVGLGRDYYVSSKKYEVTESWDGFSTSNSALKKN